MKSLYLVSSLTFGRDSARYWELIAVLAVVSVVLWAFVLVSIILRFTARLVWQRRLPSPMASSDADRVSTDS